MRPDSQKELSGGNFLLITRRFLLRKLLRAKLLKSSFSLSGVKTPTAVAESAQIVAKRILSQPLS